MKKILSELVNLFYPNLCIICGETMHKSESQVCLSCIQNIPRTNYHLISNNPVEQKFWGKVDVYRASSFYFFYKGSPFQKLLHELKYKNNRQIGQEMGRLAAVELIDSELLSSVDIIMPIPLHPKKYALRGYNQSEYIARGLAEIAEKTLDITSLTRVYENTTQTKKSVYARYENTKGIFECDAAKLLEGKHILLVDDVLTTGSTLEAAVKALEIVPNIKVSIFTLAVAT